MIIALNAKITNYKYQTKMAMALIKQKIQSNEQNQTSIMVSEKFFTTTSFKEEEEGKQMEDNEMTQTKPL